MHDAPRLALQERRSLSKLALGLLLAAALGGGSFAVWYFIAGQGSERKGQEAEAEKTANEMRGLARAGELLLGAKRKMAEGRPAEASVLVAEALDIAPHDPEARRLQEEYQAPATVVVPAHHPTIQAAIDAARPGDMVRVRPGMYHEAIMLRSGVSLIGTDKKRCRIGAVDGAAAMLTALD